MSEEVKVDDAIDEAALDAEIAASVAAVQAGQTLANAPAGATGGSEAGATGTAAPTGATEPTGATGPTGAEDGAAQPTGQDMEIRTPVQGKFESDDAYAKRVEVFDLARRRRAATTPEAKAAISEEMKKAKGELKALANPTGRFNQLRTEVNPAENVDPNDPNLKADQERLKQLGGATKEDVADIVRAERVAQENASDLEKFVGSKPELADADLREVFFDFVDQNYNWQDKTGADFRALLSMAYDNMFRPSETIQERVLKGANVAEKVGVMSFPGGTGAKTDFSPEMRKSIDELKATGMTEEKAIELLSD